LKSPYLFFSPLSQALHEWRDRIARQEDESTGYVLPNKALIEIGIAIYLDFHGAKLVL